jgi:hypothetical protein
MMAPETDATTSVRKAEMSFMLGVNWDMQGLYTVRCQPDTKRRRNTRRGAFGIQQCLNWPPNPVNFAQISSAHTWSPFEVVLGLLKMSLKLIYSHSAPRHWSIF